MPASRAACALAMLLCTAALATGCEQEDPRLDERIAAAKSAAPFYAAIEASNEATRLTNRYMSGDTPPDETELQEILQHTRAAIEHAAGLEDEVLERMHPDMREQFRNRYEASLARIADGIRNKDPDLMAEGHWMLDQWAVWIEEHTDEIRFPPYLPPEDE